VKLFENCIRGYIMVVQKGGQSRLRATKRRRCKDHVESLPWVLRRAE
jgi:hypothetical protein